MSHQPTLRDLIQLEIPNEAVISPHGQRVAILVRTTHWKENRYETHCLVHDRTTGATNPLNRQGHVHQAEWLDDHTLALLKSGPGEEIKAQIWLYEGLVGDGWAVTEHKTGVEWFKPFAGGFLFRARHPERDEKKARNERFGKFTHVEQETSAAALYYVGLNEMRDYQAQVRAATEDEAKQPVLPVVELSRLLKEPLAIQQVIPAPTGDALYLNCQARDDLVYYRATSVYCVRLNAQAALAKHIEQEKAKQRAKKEGAADAGEGQQTTPEDLAYLGEISQLHLPAEAAITAVSPDGRKLLVAHRGRDDKMYSQQDLWIIEQSHALQAPDAADFLVNLRNISAALDQAILDRYWVASGIWGAYAEGTALHIARFGEDGQVTRLDLQGLFPLWGFHIGANGQIALVATNAQRFPDVYWVEPSSNGQLADNTPVFKQNGIKLQRLTDYAEAVSQWDLGTVETIRWRSKDGAEIEGVLRKPANFDPTKRYPLVFVVHGGPTWFSAAHLLNEEDCAYYPSIQFIHKDVLVLKPNYRGSIGYGQAFTELNVNNLGVGDLWDLESAIEHLAALGWVDPARVGCMGWSQGGYISAFAALHSDKFKAASVGAGISDWYTYHISNDIPDFTVDYLSGSPFHNRELYIKTAPISNIANAKTPTLIQHGADDHRVPLSNAMELYRGLKEVGVPVELFVFPGMGHPITKPRENHAVMHQNLTWFCHYLLGEDLKLE